MAIDLCIPYIKIGIHFLENLIENIKLTCSDLNNIKIKVSYHHNEDYEILRNSNCYKYIDKTIKANFDSRGHFYSHSVNHSNAINALFSICDSEYQIFMDYDMFFLKKSWDIDIIEKIRDVDLIGVTYKKDNISIKKFTNKNIFSRKYQNLPNLSFFASNLKCLKKNFGKKLTNFSDIASEDNFSPFKIIGNEKLSKVYNLDENEIIWIDTGYDIPVKIFENKLSYINLELSSNFFFIKENENPLLSPECFCLNDVPFIAHFKKGSTKLSINKIKYSESFEKFYSTIKTYINQNIN